MVVRNENRDITADRLIKRLYQTTREISKGLNMTLSECNIYSSEWTVIKAIKECGPMTQVALANYLCIEPAAISKTLGKLAGKNIIDKQDGQDKREKYVYLTPYAEMKYDELAEIVDNHRQAILRDLSEEDFAKGIWLLEKIMANANEFNSSMK